MHLPLRTTAITCLLGVGLQLTIAAKSTTGKQLIDQSSNLRGANVYVPSESHMLCRIITIETFSVLAEGTSSREKLTCIPIIDQRESDLDFDISLPRDFFDLYEDEIQQGKLLVSITDAAIVDGKLVLGENPQYSVVTDHRYRHLQERHLQVKPVMTVAVVRISTSDSSPSSSAADLKEKLFDTEVNFSSQYDACSFGQLKWQLASSGVTDVHLSNTIASFGSLPDLISAAQQSLKDTAGVSAVSDLADKVIMCIPPGTGDWTGSAGVNHWRAQMNNSWCTSLSGIMHELGHTMGLSHARADGMEYGDRTGYMGSGFASSAWPRKCFNGYNSWKFGWYSDYHLSMNPLNDGAKLVSLATFVDKERTERGESVIANVDGQFYLLYNKKKGFNIDTEHKQDAVSITKPHSSGTESLEGLMAGEQFKKSNFNGSGQTLVIKACGTRQGSNGADVMLMSIAMDGDICNSETSATTTTSTISSTPSRTSIPTLSPTTSPIAIPSPTAMPTLSLSKSPISTPSTSISSQETEERPAAGSSNNLLTWLLSLFK